MGVPSLRGYEDEGRETGGGPPETATPSRSERTPTPRAVVYLERIAKKMRRWEVLNDKTYAYIVAACEGQHSPMEVVYHHADAVKALLPDMAGAGQAPTAVKLLAALVTRFSQGRNIGIV
jgi:hypothetical protein